MMRLLRVFVVSAVLVSWVLTYDQAKATPQGGCVAFDLTQYFEAQSEFVPTNSSFSVSLWVYLIDNYGSYSEFISQGAQPEAFYMGVNPAYGLRLGDSWEMTSIQIPRRTWTHIALTRQSGGEGSVYINGQLREQRQNYRTSTRGRSTRLGAQFGEGAYERFAGCLDDLAVYSRAISESEVGNLFSRSNYRDIPSLVAYFDFDDPEKESTFVADAGDQSVRFNGAVSAVVSPSSSPQSGRITRYPNGAISTSTPGPGVNQNYYIEGNFQRQIPQSFGEGFSWYASMWPMFTDGVSNANVGLGSTWVFPYLEEQSLAVAQALCGNGADPGVKELASNPANGKYGLYLMQTIEGSLGWWAGQKFKTPFPKYALNLTQNCYQSQIATPGWKFFQGVEPLSSGQTGLVQLTNRMLIPPDGITFQPRFGISQLGIAWYSLPFPALGANSSVPSGARAWSLFLNTENYSGVVGYALPQFWAAGSQLNPVQSGLTLDTRVGRIGGMAAEWGAIPYAEYVDADGTLYSKIPRMRFYSDPNKYLALNRDVAGYSAEFISRQFSSFLDGNSPIPTRGSTNSIFLPGTTTANRTLYQNGDLLVQPTELLQSRTIESGRAYGFTWTEPNSEIVIAEYFKKEGDRRVAINENNVPAPLRQVTFSPGSLNDSAVYRAPSWWFEGAIYSDEQSVDLVDGTRATYRWFRISDQPSLKRVGLSQSEKVKLQQIGEQIQASWQSGTLQPSATTGSLASFDSAILVQPPPQYAIGYVPIVVKQERTADAVSLQDRAYRDARQKWEASQLAQRVSPKPVPPITAKPKVPQTSKKVARPKSGASCKNVGATRKSEGQRFVCARAGNRLVWKQLR